MQFNVRKYEETTAYERLLLDRMMPLIPVRDGHSVIDLRAGGDSISVAVHLADAAAARATVGGGGRLLEPVDILPLVFGAAWKVIDILVELILEDSSVAKRSKHKEYSLNQKTDAAKKGQVSPILPFGRHQPEWRRVMLAYSSTKVIRDSLIHRELNVDPSSGLMTPQSKPNEPVARRLTGPQAFAFCRSVQGTASAVIDGDLSTREAGQLRWLLDQLSPLHELPTLGGAEVGGVIPDVLANAEPISETQVAANFPHILALAQRAVGGVKHYNLQLYLPDGRILGGELEEAPSQRLVFRPDSPPKWLRLT